MFDALRMLYCYSCPVKGNTTHLQTVCQGLSDVLPKGVFKQLPAGLFEVLHHIGSGDKTQKDF